MRDAVALADELMGGGDVSAPALAELLAGVESFVRKYVVMGRAELVAVALWVPHVYAFDAADTTPYLAVTSATKRSGKSRLLEVLEALLGTGRSLFTSNMTPAALYRVVDAAPGRALLMDEYDRIGNKERAEELAGLVNSGFRRRGGAAYRVVGKGADLKVAPFSTFSPKALAGIGTLPDTVADRAIPIRMRPKLATEQVARFRERDFEQAAPIRGGLGTWAGFATEELRAARPEIPAELNDRAQDAWEPLLAIANMAGADWPTRAWAAAVELHSRAADIADESANLLALAHVREAFGETDRMATADLLRVLVQRDDGPWAGWWGDDLDRGHVQAPAQRLRRLLAPFGVKSKTVRIDGKTPRGYERADFTDTWARHLADPSGAATGETGTTPQVAPTSDVAPVAAVAPLDGPGPGHPDDADDAVAVGQVVAAIVREFAAEVLPPDPLDVIRQQRAAGRADHATAGLLNSGGYQPPPGFARWTGYAVRVAMGEAGDAA